jgi:hypothetical protein
MDMSRCAPTAAAAAKLAQSLPQSETDMRNRPRNSEPVATPQQAESALKTSGYGLPCAKCRLYYPANLDVCPACNHKERVTANVAPAIPKPQVAAEPVPDTDVVEQEREAFLKEFKSQLFAAHAEVTTHKTQSPLPSASPVMTICRNASMFAKRRFTSTSRMPHKLSTMRYGPTPPIPARPTPMRRALCLQNYASALEYPA